MSKSLINFIKVIYIKHHQRQMMQYIQVCNSI